MSLTLKLGSLAIRTLAKPIGNYIKRNAREHERFRQICVGLAQRLHRVDMRLRLGLLQDPAVIERQIARELAEAEAKRAKAKPQIPTVKTEAETRAEEQLVKKERKVIEKHVKAPPRIRPLSESKAIDTGANFISETFLFLVAGGVIVFENWRSRRKATSRREDIKERLDTLEREKEEMRLQIEELSALTEKLAELEAANTREGSGHRKSATNGGSKAAPKAPTTQQPSPPAQVTYSVTTQATPPSPSQDSATSDEIKSKVAVYQFQSVFSRKENPPPPTS